MHNSAELVILGLGTNRPWNSIDCPVLLEKAIACLGSLLLGMRQAPVYETRPVCSSAINNFLNTAVSGFFCGTPHELLAQTQQVEAWFGRDRSLEIRWGDRSLDIDILLFGPRVLSTPDLVIPHPRLIERRFALEPLLELLPEAVSPETGESYRLICDGLPAEGIRKL